MVLLDKTSRLLFSTKANFYYPMISSQTSVWFLRRVALVCLGAGLLSGSIAWGNESPRSLVIVSPRQVLAGSNFDVAVNVAAKDGYGEQVAFLHGELSRDNGKTWEGFCFAENLGPKSNRRISVTAGEPGSVVIVRVRACFRGAEGDVDYVGNPILWEKSWERWDEPPARRVLVRVLAP